MQEEGRAALSIPSTAPRGRLLLVATAAVLTFAADLASKQWALATLTPGVSRDLLGPWLRLTLIRNPGAAFSLGTGVTWLLTAVTLVIVVVLVRTAPKVTHGLWALAFGLLIGGGLGNLLDRLVRPPGPGRGHVVDFIDYRVFVGNVADIAIVAAAILLGLLSMRGIPMNDQPAEPS